MLLVLTEVGATVRYKHVELFEAALVEELGNTFAGSVFAACMLLFNSLFTASKACLSALVDEALESFLLRWS